MLLMYRSVCTWSYYCAVLRSMVCTTPEALMCCQLLWGWDASIFICSGGFHDSLLSMTWDRAYTPTLATVSLMSVNSSLTCFIKNHTYYNFDLLILYVLYFLATDCYNLVKDFIQNKFNCWIELWSLICLFFSLGFGFKNDILGVFNKFAISTDN
jgi:hypothetical protein